MCERLVMCMGYQPSSCGMCARRSKVVNSDIHELCTRTGSDQSDFESAGFDLHRFAKLL
jgi:hypothetical protein